MHRLLKLMEEYILKIQKHIIEVHAALLEWFDASQSLKTYRPIDGGWTISEVLEHVELTSHFLLKLIEKSANKSMRKAETLPTNHLISSYDLSLDRINRIGIHKSFLWTRPEHMEPKGDKQELNVKKGLVYQLNSCLTWLQILDSGQGLLHQTTMSVDGLGKLNVYEYIYFLSKHAERHLQQMAENKTEYEAIK